MAGRSEWDDPEDQLLNSDGTKDKVKIPTLVKNAGVGSLLLISNVLMEVGGEQLLSSA